MPQHKHIIIDAPGEERNYTRPPRGGGGEFRTPPRDRRVHAIQLQEDIQQAKDEARTKAQETGHIIHNLCLEIMGEQDYALKIESLQDLRHPPSIEVLSVKQVDNQVHATIYVPENKLTNFVRKIEQYENENTTSKHPRPKNEDLVAGISGIRFPVLHSFWTDDENLFPSSNTERIWWEVWIRVAPSENSDDAFASFVATTADSNLRISQNPIKFPERLVFLAHGSTKDWTQVFVPILDRIAEFRKAKEIPTEFLNLSAQDQRSFVDDLAERIVLPDANAPAVCLLDFGVHTEHPLLRPLLTDDDAQAYDPEWSVVERDKSHGTEMAGLAIFGDRLPELLAGNQRVNLTHRLESIRMLHSKHPHPEDTWGYVTQASLAKAEIQAAQRSRVACLAVTSNDEGRDHGRPSSWSGAIDQHASGQLDDHKRLYVISAGNIQDIITNSNYQYLESNLSNSIQD